MVGCRSARRIGSATPNPLNKAVLRAGLLALLAGALGPASAVHAASVTSSAMADHALDLAALDRAGEAPATSCASLGPTASTLGVAPPIDRPRCVAAATPQRQEFRFGGDNGSLLLGFGNALERSAGEIRALFKTRHTLSSGPLAGWRLLADVMLGRPAVMALDPLLHERLHIGLGKDFAGGWSLDLNAATGARGSLDPTEAPLQHLELSAGLSRGFRVPGSDAEHRLNLDLSEVRDADRTDGTETRTSRARLSYTHDFALGTVGANLGVSRSDPAPDAGALETRFRLSFSRPF